MAGVVPSGATLVVDATTSKTVTVTVSITTLGTDLDYEYFVSRSSTNDAESTMTDVPLAAQTADQTLTLTGLSDATTYYLFVRAQDMGSRNYTPLSTTGVEVTTLGITATVEITHVTIYYQSTGEIVVTPGGGVAPYSYVWSSDTSPSTLTSSATQSALMAGDYRVEISDSGDATPQTFTYTVNENRPITIRPGLALNDKGYGDGSIGGAGVYDFDGTTSYGEVVVTNDVNLFRGCCTFICWIKVSERRENAPVIEIYNDVEGTAVDRLIMYQGALGSILFESDGSTIDSTYVPPLNTWTHVAVTVAEDGEVKWYVEGILYSAGTITPIVQKVRNRTYWGKSTVAEHPLWKGSMAELAVCDAPLTEDEVLQVYNKTALILNEISNSILYSFGSASLLSVKSRDAIAIDATERVHMLLHGHTPSSARLDLTLHPTVACIEGGTGVYVSFQWTSRNGAVEVTQDASPKTALTTGNYDLRVTDSVGGIGGFTFDILQVEIYPSAVVNSDYGLSTGSIGSTMITSTVYGGGGNMYEYLWTSSAGASTITQQDGTAKSGLSAGQYTVLITDPSGATWTHMYTVGENAQPLTITAGIVTDVTIFGEATGSIGQTLIAGGTGVYVGYTWTSSNGGTQITTQDLSEKTGLKAGTYSLTVTDDGGATDTHVYTLTQNPVITVTPGLVTNVEIFGESTGSIGETVVAGGSEVFTYEWTSSGTAITSQDLTEKTGLSAGTYTLVATDDENATATYVYTVTQNPVITLTPGAVVPTVYEESTGSIGETLVSGGSETYVGYDWTSTGTPITSQDLSAKTGLSAGTYTLVATDDVGATATHVYTITENSDLTLIPGLVTDIDIFGESTGSIGETLVLGGSGVFMYQWTSTATPITSQDLSEKTDLSAGTYTLLVTDEAGDSATHVYTLTENPVITITPGTVTKVQIFGESTASIGETLVAGGSEVFSYEWTSTGTEITTQDPSEKTGLSAGIYTLVVSDDVGASATYVYTVTENPVITVTPGAVIPAVYGEENGSIGETLVSGGSGVYLNYNWTSTGTTPITSQDLSEKTDLGVGTYTLVVTDDAGAFGTHVYTITENSDLTLTPGLATDIEIFGESTGSIGETLIAGGSGVFSYEWTSTGTPITSQDLSEKTGLSAGQYTVLITDDVGDSATHVYTLTENPVITITPGTVTKVQIFGESTASIGETLVEGGSGVFSYEWTSTGTEITTQDLSEKTGLSAGIYTLVVSDDVGAGATYVYTVTENPVITVTPGAVTATINGASTGSIAETSVSGGSGVFETYEWTSTGTAITSQDLSEKTGLSAGTYTLVATDDVGASATQVYTVTENPVITITPGSVQHVEIYGQTTGSISETQVVGGSGVFDYEWTSTTTTTPITSQDLSAKTDLAAGTYQLVVTDDLGDTAEYTYTITQNPAVTLTPGQVVKVDVFGQSTGIIGETQVSGGTGVFTYEWISTGTEITTQDLSEKTDLSAGTYTLVATDDVGGTATYVYTVEQNQIITITPTSTSNVGIYGQSTGSIGQTLVEGGSEVYVSYEWTSTATSITTQDLSEKTGLSAGIYTLVVTDNVGETGTYVYTITENPELILTPGTVSKVAVYQQSTGSISETVIEGGSGSYVYQWTSSNGGSVITDQDHTTAKTGLSAGTYTLLVLDTAGASQTHVYTVTQNPVITLTPGTVTRVLIHGESTASIGETLVQGGSGVYLTYDWTSTATPITTQDLSAKTSLSAGTYTLVVTDDVGGVGTYEYTVEENPVITITPGIVFRVAVHGESTGKIRATRVQGGTGSFVYEWTSSDGGTEILTQDLSEKSGLSAGTYTLVATDNVGASATHVYTVSQNPVTANPVISITPGAVIDVAIFGESTGSIGESFVEGGSGVYLSYTWISLDGGTEITTQDLSEKTGLSAGVYVLSVTDDQDAEGVYMYTITQNPVITLTAGAVTNIDVYGESTGVIGETLVAGGSSVFTYQWTSTGTEITTQDATEKTGLGAGTYTLVVTDDVGATSTQVYTLEQNPLLVILPGAVTNVNIFGQSTASIATTVVNGGTGSYTYEWTSSDGATEITLQDLTPKTGLSAGVYTLVATDDVGASATHVYTVEQNPVITLTPGDVVHVEIFGQSTGSISETLVEGGSGNLVSYVWTSTSGGTEITSQDLSAKSDLHAGSYILVVTDDVGATATQVYTVEQNAVITLTPGEVTNIEINGSSTGAVSATVASGGTGVYSYMWSSVPEYTLTQDVAAQTGVKAGQYTLVVGDSVGAPTVSQVYTITENPVITITPAAVTPVLIFGQSTGSIGETLVAGGSGVYSTYTWTSSNGGTEITAQDLSAKSNLHAGTYTLVVTDSVGATKTQVYTVTQNTELVIVPGAVTGTSVAGGNDGAIAAASFSGGVPVYSYSWSGTSTSTLTQSALVQTGLKSGNYTLTVTDSVGATQTHIYTINVVITISPGVIKPAAIFGSSTGSITYTDSALLQRYSFDGTLTGSGVLKLALQNTSTTLGTPTYAVGPVVGTQSLVIPTLSSYMSLPFNSALNFNKGTPFSCGGWYYIATVNEYPMYLSNANTSGGVELFTHPDTTLITINPPTEGTSTSGSRSSQLGKWVHNWLTFDGSVFRLYSDSILLCTSAVVNNSFASSLGWNICYSPRTSVGNWSMTGRVADIRWYSGVTSPAVAMAAPSGEALTGGSGIYNSVVWSSSTGATQNLPADMSDKTALKAGTYSVLVTDSAAATASRNYVVGENTLISITPGVITNASTVGGTNGAIAAATVTGGTGVYVSRSWSSNTTSTLVQDANTQSGLKAGRYTMLVTDSAGGTQTQVYNVSDMVIAPGIITTVSVNGGSDGSIGAATITGGSGVFTVYAWSGSTSSTLVQNATTQSGLKAGTYTVLVTDSLGGTKSYVYTVPQNPVITVGAGTVTKAAVKGGSTGSIKYGDPALLQRYSFDGTLSGEGSLDLSLQSTGTTLGTPSYIVGPVANTQSLIVPAGKYLQLPYSTALDFKTATPFSMGGWLFVSASASSNAHVMSNLSSSSTNGIDWYTWNNGANVANWVNNSLIGGDYTLSSNAYGRWVHHWMTYDGTNMRMYESGTLKATGARTSDFNSVSPWTLCVCVKTVNQTLTGRIADIRFYSGVVTPAVAMAAPSAALTGGTGVYTSSIWTSSEGATQNLPADMSDKTALKAGTYSVLVTDSAAATASRDYVVGENDVITVITGSVTNVLVNGSSTGAISATVAAGGTGSYTYAWSSVPVYTLTQNVAAQTGLRAGVYTLVVGDSAGAPTVTQVYTVTELPAITLTPGVVSPVLINGQSTGSITATTNVTGGSGSFVSYVWTSSNGGTTGLAATLDAKSGLHAGTYTLVVTDSVGGKCTQVYTVTENPVITITAGAITTVSVNAGSDGAIGAATITGGSGVYATYTWSGSTTSTLTQNATTQSGLKAGTYTLLVTDSVGGTKSYVYTVPQNPVISITPGIVTKATVFGASTGSIKLATVASTGIWNYDLNAIKAYSISHTGTQCLNITGLSQTVSTYPTVTVPTLSFAQSFTIEAFIYPTSGAQQIFMLSDAGVNNQDFFFSYSNLMIQGSYGANGTYYNTNTPTVNTWNHVALGYDSTLKKIYCAVNGSVVSGSTVSSAALTVTGVKPINIFFRNDGLGQYTTGYLDNFRVSQACLYTANYTVPSPVTAGWAQGGTTLYYENFEGAATLLQRYAFDGTLESEGDLHLALSDTSSLGSVSYSSGPLPNSQALELKTGGKYLTVPYNTALNFDGKSNFSMGCWMYISACVGPYLFPFSNQGIQYNYYDSAGGVSLWMNGFGTIVGGNTPTTTPLNKWIHYWMTYNGSQFTIYHNGVQTVTGTRGSTNISANQKAWLFGAAYSPSNSMTVTGKVHDVRFYSGVVSAASVMGTGLLLQRYSFNGTLSGDGSLGLALQNTSTTLGTPTYVAGPTAGVQALSLPLSKYVKLPYSSSLDFGTSTPFSMGGYFRVISTTGSNGHLLSSQNPGTTGPLIYYQSNTVYIVADSRGNYSSAITGMLGVWTHVWITYNGSILTWYKNGVQSTTSSIGVFPTSLNPWTLGFSERSGYEGQTSVSEVADVRWYSGVVAPSVAMTSIVPTVPAIPVTGGTGTYSSYVWTSSAGATQNLPSDMSDKTALKAGTYTVLVTDSATATASRDYVVDQNAVISTTRGTTTNVLVNGASTGAISATVAAGGSGSYTYAWTSVPVYTLTQNVAAHTGLKAGVYTVVVGDSAGAPTVTEVYTITENPVITLTPGVASPVLINNQSTGSITATTNVAGGSGTFVSYIWTSTNGGTTGLAATPAAKSGLHAGTYTLVITDSVGGTKTQVYTVPENPVITITPGTMKTVSIFGGSDGAILSAATLSGGSGVFTSTYLWTSGTTSTVTQNVLTQSSLKAGNYTLTVYDSVGASGTYVYTVPQNAVISIGGSITNVAINAGSTGSIRFADPALLQRYSFDGTLSGGGVLNLALQNTASTLGTPTYAAGPVAGTQALVIPSFSSYLALPFNSTLNFDRGTAFSCGGWYYMATTNQYPMYLSNTSGTRGVEFFTDGATTTLNLRVFAPSVGNVFNYATCASQVNTWVHTWLTYDGSIFRMYVNGTMLFTSTSPTDSFASGLGWNICYTPRNSVGQWSMTGRVSDIRWYTGVVSSAIAMDPASGSGSNSAITGGTGVYPSTVWTSSVGATQNLPANMDNKTGLKAGTYSVAVVDSATATASKSYTLTENAVITTTRASITHVLINGASTGALSATGAAGGTGVYTFTWSSTTTSTLVQNAPAQSGLRAGTYTVVVGDSAGAPTVTQVYIITENPVITITPAVVTNVGINGQSTGQINTTMVRGGSGTYASYVWTSSNGGTPGLSTLGVQTMLHAGTYALTVTDSVGATASYTYTITESPVMTMSFTAITHAIDSGFGSITASGVGGTGVYTYVWTSSGNTATPITASIAAPTGLDAGTYTLTLSDSAGSTATQSTEIVRRQSVSFPTTTDASAFGTCSSTSELYTIVGSPDSASSTGAAYIYLSNGSTWTLQQRLVPSDPTVNAKFGYSVGISGDYCVVGSYNNNCAYVFVRSGTTWTQQAKIQGGDVVSGDQFGYSVAINDVYCSVGAQMSGAQDTGAVYVFKRTLTAWDQVTKLSASDASANDRLGGSLAMSGLTIVAGATGYDSKSPALSESGAAYVFSSSNGSSWSQQAKLNATAPQAGSLFGSVVCIDKDTVVVGASGLGGGAGGAYVFSRSGTSWSQQTLIIPSDN